MCECNQRVLSQYKNTITEHKPKKVV